MTGREWARVLNRALARHADDPTPQQVAEMAVELFPRRWDGPQIGTLPALSFFWLSERRKTISYMREAAQESGIDPALSYAALRGRFCDDLLPEQDSLNGRPESPANRGRDAVPGPTQAVHP